jgi:hypothetical protein
MKFWIERMIPLMPMPYPIRLDAERRAAIRRGKYTESLSRYLVLGTFEEFGIECWHPFRKHHRRDYYECFALQNRCSGVKRMTNQEHWKQNESIS